MNKLWEYFSKWSTTILWGMIMLFGMDYSQPVNAFLVSFVMLFMCYVVDVVLHATCPECEKRKGFKHDNIH